MVARAGQDPTAFAALYDRYVERIYAYVARQVEETAVAQDITAATFEKAALTLQQRAVRMTRHDDVDTAPIHPFVGLGHIFGLGDVALEEGEVVDATFMSAAHLDEFLEQQVAKAQADGVLFSAHLKATMMKVSDPIIFGHVVETFLPSVFEQHGETLRKAGLSSSNGLGAILNGLDKLPARGTVEVGGLTLPMARTYGDVAPGALAALSVFANVSRTSAS